jgi:hypothetical protein
MTTTTKPTTTVSTASGEGYEAIPIQPHALDTPDVGEEVHISASNLHTVADVVLLDGVSHSSSRVSALLKRYVWRAFLALVSLITAIAVLVGNTILGASLTNTDSIISNVQAEVQSIMLANNGGMKRNSSTAS